MKKVFLYLINMLIYIGSLKNLKAQVPADSLTGVYVGDFWVANPSSGPWVITPDTFYVFINDTVACSAQATNFSNYSIGCTYYTDYYSCNGAEPTTFFIKFYSMDSVKVIENNVPQPPPNQPISRRFFGKRISGLTTSIPNFKTDGEISCYPNPANDVLNITAGIKTKISKVEIINSSGTAVNFSFHSFESNEMQIPLSSFPEGVYTIRVLAERTVITCMIIIRQN